MAGTSAGRCHGGPPSSPSISWGFSAAPGGHRPSVLPWMEIYSLTLRGHRDWGDAGECGWGTHGHLGQSEPFSRGYFSGTPSARGNEGVQDNGKMFIVHQERNQKGFWSGRPRCFAAALPPIGLAIDGSALSCLHLGALVLARWQSSELLPECRGPCPGSVAAEPGRPAPPPSPAARSGCSLLNFLLFCWFPSGAMPPGPRCFPTHRAQPGQAPTFV